MDPTGDRNSMQQPAAAPPTDQMQRLSMQQRSQPGSGLPSRNNSVRNSQSLKPTDARGDSVDSGNEVKPFNINNQAALLARMRAENSVSQKIAYCTAYLYNKYCKIGDKIDQKIEDLNEAAKGDPNLLYPLHFACCWMTRKCDMAVLSDEDVNRRLGVVNFLVSFILQERKPDSDVRATSMHLSQVEDRVPVLCDLFAVARLEGDLPLTVSHHKAIYTTSLPLKEDNLFRILKGFQFQQEFKLSMLVKSLKEHDEDERRNLLDHITQVASQGSAETKPSADIFALARVRIGLPVDKKVVDALDPSVLSIRLLQSDALALLKEDKLDDADCVKILDSYLKHRDERDTLSPHAKLSRLQVALEKISPKASKHYFALCRLAHEFPISRGDVLATCEFGAYHPHNIPAYVTQRYLYSRGSATEARRKLITLICLADRAGIKHVNIVNTFSEVLAREGFLMDDLGKEGEEASPDGSGVGANGNPPPSGGQSTEKAGYEPAGGSRPDSDPQADGRNGLGASNGVAGTGSGKIARKSTELADEDDSDDFTEPESAHEPAQRQTRPADRI